MQVIQLQLGSWDVTAVTDFLGMFETDSFDQYLCWTEEREAKKAPIGKYMFAGSKGSASCIK
jgi:hypothetical protein